ncbi:unnamed protein product [Peronospora destructor]|uniref:Uncharacterized protein n=1 Tax=Peronospora destructor TaxID=86335 RepID=A0AAV0UP41_9STRA|nr:unnamed protein product [Peronospora destructor]
MVSLRGHSISSRIWTRKNAETGTTSVMPSPNFSSMTTKKETTSNGGAVTIVTTTTTTVSALNASNSTASSSIGATGLANSAKGGECWQRHHYDYCDNTK